jgi:hypothetical protein
LVVDTVARLLCRIVWIGMWRGDAHLTVGQNPLMTRVSDFAQMGEISPNWVDGLCA